MGSMIINGDPTVNATYLIDLYDLKNNENKLGFTFNNHYSFEDPNIRIIEYIKDNLSLQARIIDSNSNNFIIDAGSDQNIELGQRFGVYDTEGRIALIEVVSTNAQSSEAEVIQGNPQIGALVQNKTIY